MKRVLIVLIGLLFIGTGIFTLVSGNAKAKRCSVAAVGTVIEIQKERTTDSDGNHKYTYFPVIEYQAGDRTITKRSNSDSSSKFSFSIGGASVSSSKSKYNINDSIDIMYNPDNVEEFIIKGDKGPNFIGIFFIFLGALAAICGIIKQPIKN